MERIPIKFDYKGKSYEGHFSPVHGAGSKVWHLMIANYYKGQLTCTDGGWVFHSNSKEFEDMADFFGEYIFLWTE